MNVMRLWACLYGKGAISNDNIIIIIIIKISMKNYPLWLFGNNNQMFSKRSIFKGMP